MCSVLCVFIVFQYLLKSLSNYYSRRFVVVVGGGGGGVVRYLLPLLLPLLRQRTNRHLSVEVRVD